MRIWITVKVNGWKVNEEVVPKEVKNKKSEGDLCNVETKDFEKEEEGEECDRLGNSEEKEGHIGKRKVEEDDETEEQLKKRMKNERDTLNGTAIVEEIGQPPEVIDGMEDGVRRSTRSRKPVGTYA
ncbi:hypothetical protein MKX01_040193 [Papaver californicum]|nr:hypothetical protein MKX01_040193 [Papaver californicum]